MCNLTKDGPYDAATVHTKYPSALGAVMSIPRKPRIHLIILSSLLQHKRKGWQCRPRKMTEMKPKNQVAMITKTLQKSSDKQSQQWVITCINCKEEAKIQFCG